MRKLILKIALFILAMLAVAAGTVNYVMSHSVISVHDEIVEIILFGNVWEHSLEN